LHLEGALRTQSAFSFLIAVAIILSIAIMGWAIYERLLWNVWRMDVILLAFMLFLVAAQAVAVATTSIMMQRVERRLRRIISGEAPPELS
jgi:hypothetical protein